MGIQERKLLPNTFGKTIRKATITGYCIKFKSLKDIDLAVLDEAIRYGLAQTAAQKFKVQYNHLPNGSF